MTIPGVLSVRADDASRVRCLVRSTCRLVFGLVMTTSVGSVTASIQRFLDFAAERAANSRAGCVHSD